MIAAEPFDTKGEDGYIFRVDYLKNGFMPIRIIVTVGRRRTRFRWSMRGFISSPPRVTGFLRPSRKT